MEALVCGIDPGLHVTGYALLRLDIERPTLVDAGVCRIDRNNSLADRLRSLFCDIDGVLNDHRPSFVAVEQLYAHYQHPRTAILMGHARGVILCAAAVRGILVRSYAATRVKRFLTGNGRATKTQVQRAIQQELGLARLPEPADVADALAIAMCGAADIRQPNWECVRR